MSDSRAILCMLILMRLKTELSHFDRLRLHKAALMLNIFSKKKCFAIEDPVLAYFDEIDNLSAEIKKLQEQCNADTAKSLEQTLKEVDTRIKESYKRSTPFILQSADFVNSITDNKTLIVASAIIGILSFYGYMPANDFEFYMRQTGYPEEFFSKKDIITATVNLEKSGVIVKAVSAYRLCDSFTNVAEYKRLI